METYGEDRGFESHLSYHLIYQIIMKTEEKENKERCPKCGGKFKKNELSHASISFSSQKLCKRCRLEAEQEFTCIVTAITVSM